MHQWKKIENWSIFQKDMDKTLWLTFLGSPCISYISLSVIEHVPLCSPVSINHPHRHYTNISLLHNKRSLPRWLQTSQHSKFSRLNFSLSLDSNVKTQHHRLCFMRLGFTINKYLIFYDQISSLSRFTDRTITWVTRAYQHNRLYNAIHVGSHWKKTEQRTY